MPIEAGQQLLHYRLIEKIGEGGMGVVWKAEDTRLHRHVALKFVPESGAGQDDQVDRHLREARAASALNHPGICAIYDIGEWQGRRFIVMELLEGRGLDETIAGGQLDVQTAIEYVTQIAGALEAAHAKGIVHRDIKPANIHVTDHGQAKVLDFGLAKLSSEPERPSGPEDATRTSLDATRPGSVMGTVSYMSPEQALGKDLDPRTDLFSLGVVLYEMITGQRAFGGNTSAAVFDAILNKAPTAPVELNPQVPAELERIVNKALEKEPALRYQSAAGMSADLQRLRRDSTQSVQAPPDTAPPPAPGRGRFVVGSVIVLLLIVAGVWLSRMGDGDSDPTESPSVVTGLKIAVLPFVNVGGDPEQLYFSEGLTSEVVTELSRYGELAVMPCRSGPCEGDHADPREVGRELGVRYVLQGKVQSSPELVRVNVQLSDGDGRSVWGGSFDAERTAQDLFEMQDELTGQVVNEIAGSYGALARAELPHSRRKAPESLGSHDCVFRAYDYLQNSHTDETHLAARACIQQIVQAEPDYVDGLAWLSFFYGEEYHHRRNEPDGEYDSRERALRMAERAVALDDSNQVAHMFLGFAALLSGDDERGVKELRRAVELNPHNPIVLGMLAWFLSNTGELELAVSLAQRAKELNPYPPAFFDYPIFVDHYMHGRHEQALELTRSGLVSGQFLEPLAAAATLGQLGRTDEAAPVLAELRELWALVCERAGCDRLEIDLVRRELADRWAVSEPIIDELVEGLKKAGLPEAQ
jgi:serine/threonine protein kinase/tetratricopeptide (TPR) repeat protein